MLHFSKEKFCTESYLVLTQIQIGNSLVCGEQLLKFHLRFFSLTGMLEIFLVSMRFMGHTEIWAETTHTILVFPFCLSPFHYFYPHFSVAVIVWKSIFWFFNPGTMKDFFFNVCVTHLLHILSLCLLDLSWSKVIKAHMVQFPSSQEEPNEYLLAFGHLPVSKNGYFLYCVQSSNLLSVGGLVQ